MNINQLLQKENPIQWLIDNQDKYKLVEIKPDKVNCPKCGSDNTDSDSTGILCKGCRRIIKFEDF